MINVAKLKEKLEKHLNRKASKDEVINAKTDQLLIQQVILDEIEDLKIRITKLEK